MKVPYFPLPPIIEIPSFLTQGPPATPASKPNSPNNNISSGDSRYINPKLLGEGGTATIYCMKDVRLGRSVAFKRFKTTSNSEPINDYRSELSAVSRVHHPNVVSVFDTGKDEEGTYIIMEHIDGSDVETLVQNTPLELDRFLEFAHQCLEGLLAVHEAGLLHLDLKPSNIMIAPKKCGNHQVKLIDFGRAELIAEEGETPPQGSGMNSSIFYASPEQLLSDFLDERSDLYALGCVFYWSLSGQRPFDGKDTLGVIASHLQNNVIHLSEIAPHLPLQLTDWVMNFLQFDREQRPHSTRSSLYQLSQLAHLSS